MQNSPTTDINTVTETFCEKSGHSESAISAHSLLIRLADAGMLGAAIEQSGKSNQDEFIAFLETMSPATLDGYVQYYNLSEIPEEDLAALRFKALKSLDAQALEAALQEVNIIDSALEISRSIDETNSKIQTQMATMEREMNNGKISPDTFHDQIRTLLEADPSMIKVLFEAINMDQPDALTELLFLLFETIQIDIRELIGCTKFAPKSAIKEALYQQVIEGNAEKIIIASKGSPQVLQDPRFLAYGIVNIAQNSNTTKKLLLASRKGLKEASYDYLPN